MEKDVFAEDLNYWKTGSSSPDSWTEKAKNEILNVGGVLIAEVYGSDGSGRAMFLLEFELDGERYRVRWPVLPCRRPSATNERAARVQAATMMYHDIKARCLTARVLGARAAFLTFLLLSDGRSAAQATAPELEQRFPKLLPG